MAGMKKIKAFGVPNAERRTHFKKEPPMDIHSQKILILDFGSQTTQLIARRVREARVYCEIHPFNWPLAKIREFNPQGLILSGSPASVYDPQAPLPDPGVFELGLPVLGICYGMQVLTHLLGGRVERSSKREYGRTDLIVADFQDLFHGLDLGAPPARPSG